MRYTATLGQHAVTVMCGHLCIVMTGLMRYTETIVDQHAVTVMRCGVLLTDLIRYMGTLVGKHAHTWTLVGKHAATITGDVFGVWLGTGLMTYTGTLVGKKGCHCHVPPLWCCVDWLIEIHGDSGG